MESRLRRAWRELTKRSSSFDMFGSIGGKKIPVPTNLDFFPDGNGGTINISDDNSPKWLGLGSKTMQMYAYQYCSPLASVIDRIAEADSNGIVTFVDRKGANVPDEKLQYSERRIVKLFENPNPLQTYQEWNAQQNVIAKIFGYCPVFALKPFGFDNSYTRALFNLNPIDCNPVKNQNYDPQSEDPEINNPISEWEVTINGVKIVIPATDVIIVKDGLLDKRDSLGLPLSKVYGLDFDISNICAAKEADNVLLRKKGPLGAFTYDPKPDMAGWVPMTPDQKKTVESDLARYGLNLQQLQYFVSNIPLKWNPMSFNVRDLMTKETIKQSIESICDRMSYPAELMSGKNATYENRKSAEKYLYQSNIIPFSNRRIAYYNRFFGLHSRKLQVQYDHLPIMQEDIVNAGAARESRSKSLDIDWKNGIITYNEYRVLQGLDKVDFGDIYYNEYQKKYGNAKNESSQENT